MTANEMPRILCVDDEKNVLDGLARTLRSLYTVETAVGGQAGVIAIRDKGPFAIIVSDLRMPEMSGVQFLAIARKVSPESVRVLLTGQGDMESAISAVNDGNIFRFLTKPCPTEVLVKALASCAEQYQLIVSERVLLEQTLQGSVKALCGVLALSNPIAFGRATRVQKIVSDLMDHFQIRQRWPVEIAASLSQIGCVALPAKTQEKLYRGESLSESERQMLERVPITVEHLLANIPRLEHVREILRLSTGEYNSKGTAVPGVADAIPWGARALRIALDLDLLESEAKSGVSPFDILRSRHGFYDSEILEGLAGLRGEGKVHVVMEELKVSEICIGMTFAEDVKSSKGILLIARGQEVTHGMLERVRNCAADIGLREPIRMILPAGTPPKIPVPVAAAK